MSFIEKSAGYTIKGVQSGNQEAARKTKKNKCDILNI